MTREYRMLGGGNRIAVYHIYATRTIKAGEALTHIYQSLKWRDAFKSLDKQLEVKDKDNKKVGANLNFVAKKLKFRSQNQNLAPYGRQIWKNRCKIKL